MTPSPSDIQNIIAAADQEASSMQRGDMYSYQKILCADAVFLPPNTAAKQGEELRRWLREFIDANAVEWPRMEHGQTMIAGDLAFHEYIYTMKVTPRAGGPPATGYGKGLQVFRRESDGSWKILRNIWNARPAD